MKFLIVTFLNILQINSNLTQLLIDFQKEPKMEKSIISASISKVSNKKSVFNYNSEKYIIPASTLKLISTATAFSTLGSEFKYETTLSYTGYIQNNILHGDLIIEGNGDPSFGSNRQGMPYEIIVNQWINKLISLKISQIEGFIKIPQNENMRLDIPEDWIWGDIGNYYGALPLNFNLNENKVSFFLKSGNNVGDSVRISTSNPKIETDLVLNNLVTGGKFSGDQSIIYQSPLSPQILIKGTIPSSQSNYEIKASNFFPEKTMIQYFEQELINAGIKILHRKIIEQNKFILDKIESRKLKSLAEDANFYSINIYADALLKTAFNSSKHITFSNAINNLKSYWRYKGIDLNEIIMKDGSGLASSNKLTTYIVADFLSQISEYSFFNDFLETIPKIGYDGTVISLDKNQITQGKVRAKSGSMQQVRCYAGYFTNLQNEQFSYMIGVNNFEKSENDTVRKYLQKFLVSLIEFKE